MTRLEWDVSAWVEFSFAHPVSNVAYNILAAGLQLQPPGRNTCRGRRRAAATARSRRPKMTRTRKAVAMPGHPAGGTTRSAACRRQRSSGSRPSSGWACGGRSTWRTCLDCSPAECTASCCSGATSSCTWSRTWSGSRQRSSASASAAVSLRAMRLAGAGAGAWAGCGRA
eukprot:SAG22_NODE_1727_length_3711_cov_8.805925_3_plen_170_part_00